MLGRRRDDRRSRWAAPSELPDQVKRSMGFPAAMLRYKLPLPKGWMVPLSYLTYRIGFFVPDQPHFVIGLDCPQRTETSLGLG